MRRPAFYSRSPREPRDAAEPGATTAQNASDGSDTAHTQPAQPAMARQRWQPGRRSFALLLALVLGMGATGAVMWPKASRQLTQKDIDQAVLRTLHTTTLPSPAAKAAEIIRPSVVRVVGYGTEKTTPEAKVEKRGRNLAKGKPPEATDEAPGQQVERGVGTGVVIVDKGIILTNLHVVAGSETIKVTFFDGLESPATITGVQPENDLAVLQAQKLPDDLIPATMRSTADLQPGDQVAAVGFPFGIGPSVSAGVVSGLKRSFRSPEGKQELGNLIQFDAAANPGNSGGPLINMDGEVLGIVTAILNPTQQRTFIGIGFAVPIENAASAAGSPPF